MIQNSIDHHLGSIKPVVSTGISCLLTGAGLLSTVISLQSKVTIMYTHIYMCNVWTNHEVENESLTKDRFYWPGGGRECSCNCIYVYIYTYIHKKSTWWNTAMCKYEWLIHIKLHLHLHICWLMIQYTPMQKLTSFIGFFPTWLFEPSPLEGTSINSWLLICLIRLYGKSFRETGSLKWWKKKASTWGFQAIWKILVKLDHFPR